MPRTLTEVDNALATIELYMGDTPTYEGYGNSLAEALSRYANGLYFDVSAVDNAIDIDYLGDKDSPITDAMFTVLVKNECTGPSVINLYKDRGLPEEASAQYELRVYDGDSDIFRPLVSGDYKKGYMYTLYYTNGFFVMAGMNEAAIVSQINAVNVWQSATGKYLERIDSNIVFNPDGADLPQDGVYATVLRATNSLVTPLINDDGTTLTLSGKLDLSALTNITPREITKDTDLLTKLYYDQNTVSLVNQELNKKIIIDTLTPSEYESANGALDDGVLYFELA